MFARGWEDATATVIAARNFNSVGLHHAGMPLYSDLVLEVHPAASAPFRVQLQVKIQNALDEMRFFIPPRVGDTLNVSFDPKGSKVKVRMDPAHDRRVQNRVAEDRLAQALHAPAGEPASTEPATGSVEAQLAAAGIDPAALVRAGIDPATLAGATMTVGGRTTQLGGDAPAAAAQPGVPVLPGGSISPGDQQVSGEALRAGWPGSATLLGAMPTGRPSSEPGTTLFTLSLAVSLAGRAPYQVQSVCAVPDGKVSLLAPSTVLPVRVSWANPALLAVDWTAVS